MWPKGEKCEAEKVSVAFTGKWLPLITLLKITILICQLQHWKRKIPLGCLAQKPVSITFEVSSRGPQQVSKFPATMDTNVSLAFCFGLFSYCATCWTFCFKSLCLSILLYCISSSFSHPKLNNFFFFFFSDVKSTNDNK